jgi:hypothetical protein
MGDVVKVQFRDGVAQEVKDGDGAVKIGMAGDAPKPGTTIKIGGIVHSLNAHDGGITTQAPMRYETITPDVSADPLSDPRTPSGAPQDKTQMTANSTIKLNGLEVRVGELVRMGVLQPSPRGGFEWTPGNGPAQRGRNL